MKTVAERYSKYKTGAQNRDLAFALDRYEFQSLIYEPCHYCGVKPPEQGGGIDRVDNELGYVVENCVPSCWQCNRSKGAMPYDNFVSWLKNAKLIPLHELLCETCNMPIESVYDGWVEWMATYGRNYEVRGLRVCHHFAGRDRHCHKYSGYRYDRVQLPNGYHAADMPLDYFVGLNGAAKLLAMLDHVPYDEIARWRDVYFRLHVQSAVTPELGKF